MITTKAISICQSTFQSKFLLSSSPKSAGALSFSSIPRQKYGYGKVTMACTRASVQDPHTTLGVVPGSSKPEIKKAYRLLALQYHPDVCKDNHCTTNFQQISFAYETLMSITTPKSQSGGFEDDPCESLEGFMGVGNDSWEDWEDWMGWEGAGTLDYSNHSNDAT